MMSMPEILYSGSVKNVRGEQDSSELIFEYSDRYSIFDWGEMPDLLPQKGRALSSMAWNFFNLLEKRLGVAHHALGPVEGMDNALRVKRVAIKRPLFKDGAWDYACYQDRPTMTLVPLEVIFRFGAPAGSSLYERLSDANYKKEIGLAEQEINPQSLFEKPVIEFSTKLESSDRYVKKDEAMKISGMSETEFNKLKDQSLKVAMELKEIFKVLGIELWDGKVEWAFIAGSDSTSDRDFMLVDSIGPDELRLTYKGISLSKENLRQVYRHSSWYEAVKKAKDLAKTRGSSDWKKICTQELNSTPEILGEEKARSFSMIYCSLAQALAKQFFNQKPFAGAFELDRLAAFLEQEKKKLQ